MGIVHTQSEEESFCQNRAGAYAMRLLIFFSPTYDAVGRSGSVLPCELRGDKQSTILGRNFCTQCRTICFAAISQGRVWSVKYMGLGRFEFLEGSLRFFSLRSY